MNKDISVYPCSTMESHSAVKGNWHTTTWVNLKTILSEWSQTKENSMWFKFYKILKNGNKFIADRCLPGDRMGKGEKDCRGHEETLGGDVCVDYLGYGMNQDVHLCWQSFLKYDCCSVPKLCLTLCNSMGFSTQASLPFPISCLLCTNYIMYTVWFISVQL